MYTLRLLLCIYFGFIAYTNAQTTTTYRAAFKVYNDPAVVGALTGNMYFDAANGAKKLRYDYTIGIIEMFNFTAQIRYLGCLSGTTYDCDAETYRVPFPNYYREGNEAAAGQTFTSADGRTCTRYNKVNAQAKGVTAVWFDSNNLICRAVFDGTAKIIDFTNVVALPAVDFLLYKNWNCPQQQCNKMMDFILVFDESGSIDGASFQKEKDFAISIANSYTFGPYGVAMGLVMFSGSARRIIYPNTNQQSVINAINGVVQGRGSTCIPCGVDIAVSDFGTRGRTGASSIMIVLTDGQNNVRDNDFAPTMQAVHARNPPIYVFAIGVAGYDINQLNVIGSTIAGVTTVFTTPNWNQLQGLLNGLIVATCLDLPGNPCGPGCRGACICSQVCRCPDSCDDGDPCTQDYCTPGSGGNGCVHPPTVCNDNDACTTDTCNSNTGCIFTRINCNDNNACTNDTCIPAIGCQNNQISCDDRNPCTGDTCSPSAGCQYATVDCNRCTYPNNVTCPRINCYINECFPGNGSCIATRVVCDDGNACTNDYCNPTTGRCATTPVNCADTNRCTHDTCDPQTGCQHIPFDVPVECNDYSNCTVDTCNPTLGCVHTNVTCNDGDACTADICESAIGCTYPTKDCSKELTVGDCSVASCDSARGCYLEPIASLTLDCGLCALGEETCADQGLGAGDIAGISAGVVAGIVIAIVAVVAVAGGFGGKKLYDAYLRNKGNFQGAQVSPLYKDNGLSGTNPLFEHPQ